MAFGFTIFPSNIPGPPLALSDATVYTNLLNTGSKGSWVEIIDNALVTANCQAVIVHIGATFVDATDTSAVIDIGTDPAGGTSYTTVIADVLAGYSGNDNYSAQRWYSFPLLIASGTAVAIRGQTARGASANAAVSVQLFGGATGAPFAGTTCTTYGISGTSGTAVTPGSGVTWSSWVNIGSATAVDLQAIILGVDPIAGTAVTTDMAQFQIGVASAAISPIYTVQLTNGEIVSSPLPAAPTYAFVASGSQLQVRSRGVAGSNEAVRVALYGISAT